MVASSKVEQGRLRRAFGLSPGLDAVLKAMGCVLPSENCKLASLPNIPNELLAMEERQVIRSYKFGVVYCGQEQTTEAQALGNTHQEASKEYLTFLAFLGETIALAGWKGYRAGLDVSGGSIEVVIQATTQALSQSTPNGKVWNV